VKQCTAEQFLKDVTGHSMKIERDDGVYRHLKFRGPEPNSWNLWFDIITWPQCLVINGDMGAWTFARVNDMFTFFRDRQGDDLKINEQYWAEKILSESRFGGPSKRFVPEVYRANVISHVGEDVYDREEVLAALKDEFNDTEECESEMRRMVAKFRHEYFTFSDSWEFSGEDWSYHFVWCLHAIVWAIRQYDALQSPAKPEQHGNGSQGEESPKVMDR
jgi:hypothetical protein